MGAVAHSGNLCSGLCRPPCNHQGCWQCDEFQQKEAEARWQRTQDELKARIRAADKKITAAKSAMTMQTPERNEMAETTTITRRALEELVALTDGRVEMDWNGGDPILRDPRKEAEARAKAATAKGASAEDIAAAERLLKATPPPPTPEGWEAGLIDAETLKRFAEQMRSPVSPLRI